MSYILDALRRAQAERERGQVPGLHAQPGLGGTPRPRAGANTASRVPGWVWALGGAALVLAVLVPTVLLTRGASPVQGSAGPVEPVGPTGQARASAGLPAGVQQAAPVPANAAAPGGAVAPSAAEAPPPMVVVSAAPNTQSAAPSTVPTTAQKTAQKTSPKTAPTVPTAPAAPSGSASSTKARTASVAGTPGGQQAPAADAPAPVSPASMETAGPIVIKTAPASPFGTSPANPATTPAANASSLPPALTAEQRREWPALTVGGSVWSDTPSARFVILGGQLVHEGQSSPEGVLVERITPKAVVLRWRDQRASLPL